MIHKPYYTLSRVFDLLNVLQIREEPKLKIAEMFYSVQCEGKTAGIPSVFIRLQGCNLTCGFSPNHTKQILQTGPGQFVNIGVTGDLQTEGRATWSCDTLPVWLFGTGKTYFEVMSELKLLSLKQKFDIIEYIKQKRIHLIFTGGEPMIRHHQEAIAGFLIWLQKNFNIEPYVEIETNGTIEPLVVKNIPSMEKEEYNFYTLFIDQINCSPKLANSGMSFERRIKPSALIKVLEHPNGYFKFVVSTEKDIEEIEKDFIEPFKISPDRVLLMPGLDSREDFHERCQFLLELSKSTGYRCMPRLHISAWDKTTGV